MYSIKNALAELRGGLKYDENLNDIFDRIDSISIETQDICDVLQEKLYDYGENINIDAIESRIDEIKLLKKKYGQSIDEINDFYSKAKEEADKLSDAEQTISILNARRTQLEENIIDIVGKIHELRVITANKFAKSICSNLQELGMKTSILDVKLDCFL